MNEQPLQDQLDPTSKETSPPGTRIPGLSAVALSIFPMIAEAGHQFVHIDVGIEARVDGTQEEGGLDLENPAHRAMDRIIRALPYIMDDRWEKLVLPLLALAGPGTQIMAAQSPQEQQQEQQEQQKGDL